MTGALKTWLAFGDRPTLKERAKRDGADYPDMERRGELPAKVEQVKADRVPTARTGLFNP